MTSTHPALSPGTAALLRCAPDAIHVELEALETDAVVGAALERLSSRGDERARAYLASLGAVHRLEAALACLGQALRVPVKVRGGCCDRKGVLHPGNGLSSLLGTLSGRVDEPFTGRGTVAVLARAREAGTLVRSPRLENVSWVETKADGSTVQRRKRFLRSTLYATAPALRTWYRRPELASLVVELAQVAPPAWRQRAYLVRGTRGYWGAIRRSKAEASADRKRAAGVARRRQAWERYKRRAWGGVRTRKTKGENSSRAESSNPTPGAPTVAAGAGRGGARAEAPVVDPPTAPVSTPDKGHFADRMAAEGLDLAAWGLDASRDRLRPRFDRGADVRGPGTRPDASSGLPWRAPKYHLGNG